MVKYEGCLLAVKDIASSKAFYETVIGAKVLMDVGVHVAFEGFSLQQGYAELIGVQSDRTEGGSHNFQLYFEVENLNEWADKLKGKVEFVHEIKEYPWGQRDIRIYDPDMHIIEIAENMGVVVRRFLKQGLSPEETAERTMFPLEFVKQYI